MADQDASTRSVLLAVLGNSFIGICKFAAFLASGSNAMLSEAIHSVADTSNQALLYFGIRRARKDPDEDFPYGYGQAKFFWGLVSAMGIFFLGAGVTIYHGIEGILHPRASVDLWTTGAVLVISFLVEGAVLLAAMKALRQEIRVHEPTGSFWVYARERADPALMAVLFEDSVAVLGVLAAGAGIGLSWKTGNPVWEGVASVFIGLLLAVVAVLLAAQNRRILLDTAIPDSEEEQVLKVMQAHPMIAAVHDFKTVMFTPREFKIKAEIDVDVDWLSGEVSRQNPDATGVHEIALAIRILAGEINHIEADIRKVCPEAIHIDIEVNDGVLSEDGTPAGSEAPKRGSTPPEDRGHVG